MSKLKIFQFLARVFEFAAKYFCCPPVVSHLPARHLHLPVVGQSHIGSPMPLPNTVIPSSPPHPSAPWPALPRELPPAALHPEVPAGASPELRLGASPGGRPRRFPRSFALALPPELPPGAPPAARASPRPGAPLALHPRSSPRRCGTAYYLAASTCTSCPSSPPALLPTLCLRLRLPTLPRRFPIFFHSGERAHWLGSRPSALLHSQKVIYFLSYLLNLSCL